MKRTMLLCLALLLALWSAACGETVSLPESLGVNASQGTVQDHWDDHGGMSDGTEYWEIVFSPEDAAEFEESLQTAQGWHALPLDNDVRYLLYGTEGMEEAQDGAYISVNPYLTGRDGGKLRGLADILLNVDETETYKVQEKHLPLYHQLCMRVEARLFG